MSNQIHPYRWRCFGSTLGEFGLARPCMTVRSSTAKTTPSVGMNVVVLAVLKCTVMPCRATACGTCHEQDMTLCHVSLESLNNDKNLNKLKKWTNKVWSSTQTNGLFVTIWTGSPTQRAFVGMALNKAEIE